MLKMLQQWSSRKISLMPIGIGIAFTVQILWSSIAYSAGLGRVPDTFACGGKLEADVWGLWDSQGRVYGRENLLSRRLLTEGDTYALYDLQMYMQNLVSMAQRCGRWDRLLQMADDWTAAYSALEPLNGANSVRAWICKGGRVCNDRNRLVNTEVRLVSVQGLGLFSSLANALANSPEAKARAHSVIARTAEASGAHLLRWNGRDALRRLQRMTGARAADVVDGGTGLLFTDYYLWEIAVFANLAGIYAAEPRLASAQADQNQTMELGSAIRLLLHLFNSRLSFEMLMLPGRGTVRAADLDRGYWRLFADNRYAGYSGAEDPASCVTQPDGSKQVKVLVPASHVPLVPAIGWDISHARRLVPALIALRINREAMQKVYGLDAADLPDPDLEQAFAAQLVGRIWNGDKAQPLFSSYWNGTNGWHRVGYDDGTGRCNAGNRPFGLSASFATGGYAVWSTSYATIGEIARNIYRLTQSHDPGRAEYVQHHFPAMGPRADPDTKMLNQLMFWPSLVQ